MYRFTTPMMILLLAPGFQLAHAGPAGDVPSKVVHFGDLDLSRSEGAKVLYQRLKGAAESVCAPLDALDLSRHMNYLLCVRGAITRAVTKIGQPALTAYYEAKTNGRNSSIQIAQN